MIMALPDDAELDGLLWKAIETGDRLSPSLEARMFRCVAEHPSWAETWAAYFTYCRKFPMAADFLA
jgi:hypothetical protein